MQNGVANVDAKSRTVVRKIGKGRDAIAVDERTDFRCVTEVMKVGRETVGDVDATRGEANQFQSKLDFRFRLEVPSLRRLDEFTLRDNPLAEREAS